MSLPSRCSFSLDSRIIIPFGHSNPKASWATTRRLGQLCLQGNNRVHDRHPTIWVNRLPGNGSVSSSYALSPTNYVIHNAGSHRHFFLSRIGHMHTCIVTTGVDVPGHPCGGILKFYVINDDDA